MSGLPTDTRAADVLSATTRDLNSGTDIEFSEPPPSRANCSCAIELPAVIRQTAAAIRWTVLRFNNRNTRIRCVLC